jgi:hypothetical protein
MPSVQLPTPHDGAPPTLDPAATPRATNTAIPSNSSTVAIGAHNAPEASARHAPTAFACLQCQLIGTRRLTCSKVDACSDLPHSFLLGPILLGAWFVTAVAFVLAVL